MSKKIILVTGSSSGFGRLTAKALGRTGAVEKALRSMKRSSAALPERQR